MGEIPVLWNNDHKRRIGRVTGIKDGTVSIEITDPDVIEAIRGPYLKGLSIGGLTSTKVD